MTTTPPAKPRKTAATRKPAGGSKPQGRKGVEEPSKLEDHLDSIVEHKLAGVSDRMIADNLGVSNSAVSRFVKRPSVSKAIDQAHGELMKRAGRQLATASGLAVRTLVHYANLDTPNIPHEHRLRATKIMIDAIGIGRMADAADLLAEGSTEVAAASAREKAREIEARIVESEGTAIPGTAMSVIEGEVS